MVNIARLAVLFFCSAGAAQAAEPMRQLGMPLSKKMQLPIAQCPSQERAMQTSAPCWVAPPAILAGGIQSGTLSVPATTPRHKWAAPGNYRVEIDRNGLLLAVTVHSKGAADYIKIKSALSETFGGPRLSMTDDKARSATWLWQDAVIELNCGASDGCDTRFVLEDRNESAQRGVANTLAK